MIDSTKIKVWVETKKERDAVLMALHREGCKVGGIGVNGTPIPKRMKDDDFQNVYRVPIGFLISDKDMRIAHGQKEEFEKLFCDHVSVDAKELTRTREIRIYNNNPVVAAIDRTSGKVATAACGPDDEFDFYFGAKLALERLEKELKEPEEKFNGKVVCIDIDTELSATFTKGRIYTIKDGRIEDDYRSGFMVSDIEDLNALFPLVDFIEVVE